VTEFTLAVHRAVVDDAGREAQETIFVACLAYRDEAIRAAAIIHRGSQADIAGRLWTAPRASGKGRELVVVAENVCAGGGVPIAIEIPVQRDEGASDETEGKEA
jgi:single-stranded DNA-binding protein